MTKLAIPEKDEAAVESRKLRRHFQDLLGEKE